MDRAEFLEKCFACAVKSFVGIGPLIGGLYMAGESGFLAKGPGLLFMCLFIGYSYFAGLAPAIVAAVCWYAVVYVISYADLNKLLGMPLAFLAGSLVLSGIAGYFGVLLMVYRGMDGGHGMAIAGAVAGCVAGFMSANGVLKNVGG